jgi:Leucine-rich repeat (LRR) protein
LEGSLPTELFELIKLETLHLEAADANGLLDPAIWKFTNLKRLNLNENQLQAEIPSDLSNLTNLEYLDLSDNDWFGSLPDGFLDDCSKLLEFSLNGARAGLGGALPSFVGLKSIEVLELAYNTYCVARLVRAGFTAEVAIDRIYQIYGAHIINRMKQDRSAGIAHPLLQV